MRRVLCSKRAKGAWRIFSVGTISYLLQSVYSLPRRGSSRDPEPDILHQAVRTTRLWAVRLSRWTFVAALLRCTRQPPSSRLSNSVAGLEPITVHKTTPPMPVRVRHICRRDPLGSACFSTAQEHAQLGRAPTPALLTGQLPSRICWFTSCIFSKQVTEDACSQADRQCQYSRLSGVTATPICLVFEHIKRQPSFFCGRYDSVSSARSRNWAVTSGDW